MPSCPSLKLKKFLKITRCLIQTHKLNDKLYFHPQTYHNIIIQVSHFLEFWTIMRPTDFTFKDMLEVSVTALYAFTDKMCGVLIT